VLERPLGEHPRIALPDGTGTDVGEVGRDLIGVDLRPREGLSRLQRDGVLRGMLPPNPAMNPIESGVSSGMTSSPSRNVSSYSSSRSWKALPAKPTRRSGHPPGLPKTPSKVASNSTPVADSPQSAASVARRFAAFELASRSTAS
jgi:hypothetical protein